jgi:lipopolysaccharide transport system ATP-binding protein
VSPGASPGGAVVCTGLRKVFPVIDTGYGWRLLLTNVPAAISITALDGVDFTVPKGKFLGVLGRNGAGKSTLLRTLAGVYEPTAGRIAIDGHLCGLFELGGLGNRQLTGRKYAERWLAFHGVGRRRMAALCEEIADFSELGERFEHSIRTYSAGMAARLYFASATALQHDVYLIDEVLSVGDMHFQDKCWRRLRERFAHGASGVLVTHDWSAVLRLCEEACILEQGRVKARGPAERIIVQYLDLPRPERTSARIGLDAGHTFQITAGPGVQLDVPIEVDEDIPLAMGYAIEMLHMGLGWEILFHENFMPVTDRAGRHIASLGFDHFPLMPGSYRVTLTLTSPGSTYGGPGFRVYDTRSWTYGNSLFAKVAGGNSVAPLLQPVRWQLQDRSARDSH